jgi:acetyl-CoA carboxylase biotin carboxyl carrier protein
MVPAHAAVPRPTTMIDIRKLKELVRLMVENDLTELDIRDEQETVTVKRPGVHVAPQVIHAPMTAAMPAAVAAPVAAAPVAAPAAAPAAAKEALPAIESPMVGTFYARLGRIRRRSCRSAPRSAPTPPSA